MSAAAGREKWNWFFRDQLRPTVDWVIRKAQIAGSMRVLDLACGVGLPAIQIAERVRPGGKVVAIDNDSEMLAACRRLARTAGVDNLELREMDMHSLAFSDQTFDAVSCCSALMFARDPVRVMSEVRRVLKPAGRFALTVWDEPARNPLFTTVVGALPSEPDPTVPNPYRLAPHGELQSVLRSAGFYDFTIENVPIVIESPNAEDHVTMMSEISPVIARALEGKTDEDIAKIRQAMLASIQPYIDNGRVRIGCMPLCATASRSS